MLLPAAPARPRRALGAPQRAVGLCQHRTVLKLPMEKQGFFFIFSEAVLFTGNKTLLLCREVAGDVCNCVSIYNSTEGASRWPPSLGGSRQRESGAPVPSVLNKTLAVLRMIIYLLAHRPQKKTCLTVLETGLGFFLCACCCFGFFFPNGILVVKPVQEF